MKNKRIDEPELDRKILESLLETQATLKKLLEKQHALVESVEAIFSIIRRFIFILKIVFFPFVLLYWAAKFLFNLPRNAGNLIRVMVRRLLYLVDIFVVINFALFNLFFPGKKGENTKRILMLTISNIDIDPRINKVVNSLVAAGYNIDILCYQNFGVDVEKEEAISPGVKYIRIPHRKSWRFWMIYQDEFLKTGLKRQYDYVHANDLTTLFSAWMLARRRGTPLIYDAHEMWSENVQWNGSDWIPMNKKNRFLAFHFEKFLVKYVDIFSTVSNSIAEEYQKRYRLSSKPVLIPNYPSLSLLEGARSKAPSIRKLCDLPADYFVTLYLGGVNPLRNIENVIRAHQYLPPDCVFVIRGPGVEYYGAEYKELAKEINVEDRVYCLPPVGMDELLSGAKGADCGVLMLRNICYNFYWFYPNKFFEYMLAELPVAVSDFPDVSTHVEKERCGVTFDPDDPKSIADALYHLYSNREEAKQMGRSGRRGVLKNYNWEKGVVTLLDEYANLR